MVTRKKTTKAKATKKAPAKKAATKKKAVKKTVTKKVATQKKKSVKLGKVSSIYTKSQIIQFLSEYTELSKKEINGVFDGLSELMEGHLKKNGPGEFNLSGFCKIRRIHKPATRARKGINPFTGEETTFKAKPARNVVKVRPLKKLKEMVE